MARIGWKEGLTLAMVSGMLISCGSGVEAATRPNEQGEVEDFTPGEEIDPLALTATLWPTQTLIPLATSTRFPATTALQSGWQATATIFPTEFPATPTLERMTNPYFNKPFSQRCKQWFETDGSYTVDCAEDWAERPLPGGCKANKFSAFLGRPSCQAAATSLVLNFLVPAEEIFARLGTPGIDPAQLVWDIYPYLPEDGGRIVMDCGGAGPASIRGALELFGLSVEVPIFSKYTLVEVGESLAPNQRLMVAMIGINAKGRRFQHWTVYKRYEVANKPGYAEYSGLIPYFDDSFFYPDQWNIEDVDFEVSPNIGERADGTKNFEIVGAFIVTSPYEMPEWDTIK